MKKCTKCKTEKAERWFNKDKSRTDGLDATCKQCRHKQGKNYFENNKKRISKNHKKWYQDNREHVLEDTRKNKLKREYGITVDDYNQMVSNQNGKCAICERKRKLYIDHCHNTGKVRGLLCQKCNTGIGMLGDNAKTVQKAAEYLKK